MSLQIIGAVISSLIILWGFVAIARNLFAFITHLLDVESQQHWYNLPHGFSAAAWTFSLFWLFLPYDNLHISRTSNQKLAFALYLLAALAWLWTQRINFLNNLPADVRKEGVCWGKSLGWNGHMFLTYLIQAVCAAALGVIFLLFGSQSYLLLLMLIPLVIGTAGVSLWRLSLSETDSVTLPGRLYSSIRGGNKSATE